jgi:hypothetical protein
VSVETDRADVRKTVEEEVDGESGKKETEDLLRQPRRLMRGARLPWVLAVIGVAVAIGLAGAGEVRGRQCERQVATTVSSSDGWAVSPSGRRYGPAADRGAAP